MVIEGEDTGGGGGSAADLLGTPPAGSEQQQQETQQGDDQQQSDQGVDPDWYATLSAEADGDNASHRDYVKAKGFKTFDDVVKAYRGAEKAIHDSGRIKIPGEGAKPEEIAEYHKAIGVPDDVEGYVIAAPKDNDGNDIELDTDLLGRLSESALKHGTPKAVYEGLVSDFVKFQLDDAAAADAAQQAEADAVVKAWGKDATDKIAAVDRVAQALKFTSKDMIALRGALGAEKALHTLARLGEGMAEDVMITGGKGRFGVSGAEAKAELDRLKGDPNFDPVKNPQDKARWDRLQNAVGEWEDAKARAAA